jgi:hypothetical protein
VETREEYQKRTKAKPEELEPKVWAVKHKADDMQGATQTEYHELFRVLHSKRQQEIKKE